MKKLKVKEIALIGVLGGLSAVLMLFDFPLPIAPSFLKFDVSDVPGLFAGFFLGPVVGFFVVLIKILLNLLLNGTVTAGVGELSNLIGSAVFIISASMIYKKRHTKKGALLGLVAATVITSVLYIFINSWVAFPLYGKLYGMSTEAIVAAGAKVNPLVKDLPTMMLFSIFPFNLIKYVIVSAITYLINKKCSNTLKVILK